MSASEITNNLVANLHKRFVLTAGGLIVAILLAQVIILSTLGTKGAEISDIRAQKQDLRVEIEDLRSKIDKARTLTEIESGLQDTLELESKQVTTIQAPADLITASVDL